MTAPVAGERYHFVDGLRGLAALAVLGFHVHSAPLENALSEALPAALSYLCDRGWLGVQVFFVLSGFVIAHSLRRVGSDAGFVGRFILRRSARLDPPYWAAIGLALASGATASWLLVNRSFEAPSLGSLVAHLVYLQGILGFPQILDVFWTLCIEFQLYLVLVVLLVTWERADIQGRRGRVALAAGLLGTVLLLSLAAGQLPEASRKAWFLPYWYQFFLGVMTRWVTWGRLAGGWWWAIAAACALSGIVANAGESLVSVATATALLVASRRGGLSTWLAATPLRWLGRVSYSLYLTHPIVCSRVTSGMRRAGLLEGRELLVAGLAVLLSLAFAELFWRAVESPAMRLSRRIPLRQAEPLTSVAGAT